MRFSDALCYALLMITITSTCAAGKYTNQELEERKSDRRGKRESAIIIDSAYPLSTYTTKPNLIFDRISKSKYSTKPHYGRRKPNKRHYPPKNRAKPVMKYRRKLVRPNKFKKNKPPPLPANAKPSLQFMNPLVSAYDPPKMWNIYYPYPSEPASFSEPPKYINTEYPKKSYGEPPVDSYGTPLKYPNLQNVVESYGEPMEHPHSQTVELFTETPKNENFGQLHQSYQSYKQDANVDNINSYSKNNPVYSQHGLGAYREHQPPNEEASLHSYADVYKKSLLNDLSFWKQKNIAKKQNHNVLKNRPWKSQFINENMKEYPQKHVMVGGQYAEPPGHLIPEVQTSMSDAFPGLGESSSKFSYLDSEYAASAAISPYVNYKNSNMAFSPQNLNDAFSL